MLIRTFAVCPVCCALILGCCALFSGCSSDSSVRSFDQEFALTLRAGHGQLTDTEKSELLRENHPILAQVGEPSMLSLMELFAALPPELHGKLRENSYLKWKLSDMPDDKQKTIIRAIRFALMSRVGLSQLKEVAGEDRLPGLKVEEVEVGFAVVELQTTGKKVVSWYAFGPDLPMPLWITVVNANAATSEDYVRSHMQRLPLLRTMKSDPPPNPDLGRLSFIATCDGVEVATATTG